MAPYPKVIPPDLLRVVENEFRRKWIEAVAALPYGEFPIFAFVASSSADVARLAGIKTQSARHWLWVLIRSGKLKTCDSVGDGYPTTKFYPVEWEKLLED